MGAGGTLAKMPLYSATASLNSVFWFIVLHGHDQIRKGQI
jgi:hypothetical protein